MRCTSRAVDSKTPRPVDADPPPIGKRRYRAGPQRALSGEGALQRDRGGHPSRDPCRTRSGPRDLLSRRTVRLPLYTPSRKAVTPERPIALRRCGRRAIAEDETPAAAPVAWRASLRRADPPALEGVAASAMPSLISRPHAVRAPSSGGRRRLLRNAPAHCRRACTSRQDGPAIDRQGGAAYRWVSFVELPIHTVEGERVPMVSAPCIIKGGDARQGAGGDRWTRAPGGAGRGCGKARGRHEGTECAERRGPRAAPRRGSRRLPPRCTYRAPSSPRPPKPAGRRRGGSGRRRPSRSRRPAEWTRRGSGEPAAGSRRRCSQR